MACKDSKVPEKLAATTAVPFDKLIINSMDIMHFEMDQKNPSDSNERAFLRMMIPHHQGAIDMSLALLVHSQDSEVKNLAQMIITQQESEIKLMNLLLEQRKKKK